MDQDAKLHVYRAQTENVRATKSALKQVHRQLNSALRSGDKAALESFTKLYALLFCAWSEASFSKLIHTPYGFSLDEIKQIKREQRESGISASWRKAVRLGARHLEAKRGNFMPNVIQKLDSMIESHVFDPSLLRNKLAHGQWSIALNRDNAAVQSDLTARISDLNMIQIAAWVQTQELLCELVESLIESPKRTFMRDWWAEAERIEAKIVEAESRTLQEHLNRLKQKELRTGARGKRTSQEA